MRLTLLRHGMAEPTHQDDFARELLPEGLAQARTAGEALAAIVPPPDYVLASPAARTRQTANGVMYALKLPAQRLQWEPRLYLANAESLLEIIRAQRDTANHLLIVGHNPGLSDLTRRLGKAPITGELATGEWRTFDALPI